MDFDPQGEFLRSRPGVLRPPRPRIYPRIHAELAAKGGGEVPTVGETDGPSSFSDIDIARLQELARSLQAAIVKVAKNGGVKDLVEAHLQFVVVDADGASQFHEGGGI